MMFRSSHTDRYEECNPKKLAAYPDLYPSGGSHKSTANHQLPDDFSDLTPCQNLFRRDGKSGTNPWVFAWFPKIHGENPWCFLGFFPVLLAFSPMHFAPPGACLPTRSLFPISTSSSTSTELIAASCHTKWLGKNTSELQKIWLNPVFPVCSSICFAEIMLLRGIETSCLCIIAGRWSASPKSRIDNWGCVLCVCLVKIESQDVLESIGYIISTFSWLNPVNLSMY